MIRRWPTALVVVVVVLVLLLAGCTSFPTSGSVEEATGARPGGRRPGIDVAAQPPQPGASPEAILDGFFSASESPGDGYVVARQYLTREAAGSWRPEAGIAVYDATGQSRVVTSDGAAVLRAPLIGRLDVDQVFMAVREPDFSHNFEMTQVNGEWRIGNPGTGVLISLQRFHRAFRAVPVYYLDATGQRMVSQPVFLRQTDINPETPDALVRALIGGPGSWLRPGVLDALPSEVQSNGTWVDDSGVAHISLGQEMESLGAEQRLQAGAQLLFTLRYFEAITGIQIDVNGRPLSVRGANANGTLRMNAVSQFSPDRPEVPRDLYGLRAGSVIKITESPRMQVTTMPGLLGEGWEDAPDQLAVSWQGDQVATVNGRQRLYTAKPADGAPELLYTGSDLVKPQFDSSGQLWTMDNTPAGPVALRTAAQGDGDMVVVPLPELDGAEIVAFRISPDLTRIAVVAQFDAEQRLGFLRLRGADRLIVDGWRELPLNTARGQLTHLRDVAFVSPDRMLVLGSGENDPAFTVYSLDVDAASVISQGPTSDLDAISLTAMPIGTVGAVAVVTASQRGLRFEAQYRWQLLLDGVADLAYPS